MSDVTNLGDKRPIERSDSPMALMQKLPWKQMKTVAVVFEHDDGTVHVAHSAMMWKDKVFLMGELQVVTIQRNIMENCTCGT